ncbi:MAG: transcriptional repressor [Gammaproteobacteria bacterium RIFCSPLOWO2_01_FULL_47_190]|nr:MAG: transcriptional repressor [Gammaproteobacteria bacterium RIFCSPLOWO2_01_FULL_47_190]OGT74961.1 MAG: transcriptional repressor [Gammaproteobacteria bacterium RIFCSPLOWO2_12_47_11]OGT87604.1 MAG: transcriptional repressor [Gammaproteobacteria bacterium RIFCSPLOWO2_12_FULL_47_76]
MIVLTDNDINTGRVQALLAEHAIRPTSQRVQIAAVLFAQPQHLSADLVMSKVNRTRPIVSKATVYNTLNLFAKKGLIREVIIDSGKVFYDSNTDVHHHIYNEDTGMLLDVAADEMVIENLPDIPANTETTGIDVIIRVKNK